MSFLKEATIMDPRFKEKRTSVGTTEGDSSDGSNHRNVSYLRMRAVLITRCIFILNAIMYIATLIR